MNEDDYVAGRIGAEIILHERGIWFTLFYGRMEKELRSLK